MADRASSDDPAVQAQLDRLTLLSPGRDVLGLERISALMERLGRPQERMPATFHVAGTNGKGSTCAFLRAMVEAAGASAHVYSSPHLVRFNERIRISGRLIDDGLLAALLAEVLDAANGIAPSFFEASTAAAFLAFARNHADAAIIEVGLGGRLDATNIIARPAVCGIAQLGLDHQAFLGDDPVSIAGEKAGIAKAGVPLVTQQYPAGETERIERIADAAGAPVIQRGRDWDFGPCEDGFWYGDSRGRMEFGPPALPGAHQAGNAALAIAMLRHQNALDIPVDALAAGVRTARWPARLQRLGPGPVPALLPGTQIWIDGCHNPACAGAVAAAASTIAPPHALAVIAGILANKDAEGILAPFADSAARFATVPVPDHDHHAPEALAARLRSMGVECTPHASVAEAIVALGAGNPVPEAVLVIGSLYLAGAVLRANGEFPD